MIDTLQRILKKDKQGLGYSEKLILNFNQGNNTLFMFIKEYFTLHEE